jgi:myo-inositol 2-dehydrogenase/D-chiro-inositol 1-dehydrogenase
VIGAGAMGSQHVPAWQEAGAEVVSLTDVNEEAAKKLAKQYGVARTYADYKEAASADDVDIVDVCTPLAFHAPMTIYAAQQGKHVFCEKPLTQSVEDARAMEAAVQDAGVKFGIGFQRSISRDIDILKQWVAEDKFGSPLVINVDTMAEVRPKRVMHDARGNMGPVMDIAPHVFTMWHNILQSRARTVFAKGCILADKRPEIAHIPERAIDTALIVIEYENGALLSYNISWGLEKNSGLKSYEMRMYGPSGGVQILPRDKLIVYQGGATEDIEINQPNPVLRKHQFDVYLDALDNDKPTPVGFKQGKEALAVTLAILRSINDGTPVAVEYF